MSSPASQRHRPAGRRLVGGRYREVAHLGDGGMASVYEVEDVTTGEHLALKRAHRSVAGGELRFRREFHTLTQLTHPNIVRVREYGVDEEGSFYTMDLLRGGEVDPAASVEVLAGVLRDLCAALAFLHARRLLHRDLSLRNVLLDEEGSAILIDFGILATVGVTGEVVGTLAYLSPEAVLQLPLDHRADLYGLGALAYRLLTGHHAYPSRRMHDLLSRWDELPMPPSHHRPEVPEALDELVIRLLSRDPVVRPSAAEVIERLEGTFGLPPKGDAAVARGWLQSTVLVGRRREIVRAQLAVDASLAAGATTVPLMVAGPSGMGKSRMLQEVALRAQMAGATVVRARARRQSRPLGLLHDVVASLLVSCEADTRETAFPKASILGRVFPDLAPAVVVASALGDPAEDRLRLHHAVMTWLRDLARRRPQCWVVDDVQRADEASAAILAALAAEEVVFVAAGLRTDEAVRAPSPIEALHERAEPIILEGLSEAEVIELVTTTFGDISDAPRIAAWIHGIAGGSPLWCVELARRLVDDGVLRLEGGMWTLTDDLRHESTGGGLMVALDASVGRLAESPRAVGEALAVQGGMLPLDLCARLGGLDDEGMLFDDLASLVQEGILLAEGDSYRFRHDGLREALLRPLAPVRRSMLHRRAARALLDTAPDRDDPATQLEVGWHYHAAGDRERAAEWLERGGRQLYEAHAFVDAMAPLEEALLELERSGAKLGRALELRRMLLRAGVFCDREIILRLGDETIAEIGRRAGIPTAQRLAPRIGGIAAVTAGLATAGARWLRGGGEGPGPVAAVTSFLALVGYRSSVAALSYDLDHLEELARTVQPFAAFRGRVPASAAALVERFSDVAKGRFGAVFRGLAAGVGPLRNDHLTPLPDIDRRMGVGAFEYMAASSLALDHDPAFEAHLATLEALELRFFETGMAVVRVFFHRVRGEEKAARQWYERAAIASVQLGNGWVFQSQLAWMSSIAFGWTRDVLGLRRAIVQLERHAERGFRFDGFLHLARGEHLRERGQLDASLEALDLAEASCRHDETLLRQLIGVARAERSLAAGDPDRAAADAERVLAFGRDPLVALASLQLRAERALGLAVAASGDAEGGMARIERALVTADRLASPVLSGALHEAAARVALGLGERPLYVHHQKQCGRWFRRSENDVLLARAGRLEQEGAHSSRRSAPSSFRGSDEATTVFATSSLSTSSARYLFASEPQARLDQALRMVVEACGGDRGHLFAPGSEAPRLLASYAAVAGPEPELELAVERTLETRASQAEVTFVPIGPLPNYRLVPLLHDGRAIALAAVHPADAAGDAPITDLLRSLAAELVGRRDLEG